MIEAKTKAEENWLLVESLILQLIEYRKINKLNGKLSLVGGSMETMINVDSLMKAPVPSTN